MVAWMSISAEAPAHVRFHEPGLSRYDRALLFPSGNFSLTWHLVLLPLHLLLPVSDHYFIVFPTGFSFSILFGQFPRGSFLCLFYIFPLGDSIISSVAEGQFFFFPLLPPEKGAMWKLSRGWWLSNYTSWFNLLSETQTVFPTRHLFWDMFHRHLKPDIFKLNTSALSVSRLIPTLSFNLGDTIR